MTPTEIRHTLGPFENALQKLREDILLMASMAERNFANAARSLFERRDDLCNLVIVDDDEVDRIEVAIDGYGVELISRFQPVASDLRTVLATMKVAVELERVADQAVNIARRVRTLHRAPNAPELPLLEPMFEYAAKMLADSIAAFANKDEALARSVAERDPGLDEMNREVGETLLAAMQQGAARVRTLLSLTLIARSVERVGDHAQNIAEEAVYAASAAEIKHEHPAAPAALP